MPSYEPVARFHVSSSNSPDVSDIEVDIDDDDDVEIDERQSFISFRGGGSRRIPPSHGRIISASIPFSLMLPKKYLFPTNKERSRSKIGNVTGICHKWQPVT